MATFIKVTQEGSELLRRNTEQTQAARLGKLESDEQTRTEKEAKRQRQAELQRQGLDASGNALGDSRRRQAFRRDEPAAFAPLQSFIIYWDGLNPLITDLRATLQPGVAQTNQQASTIGDVPVISSGPPENNPAKYSNGQAIYQLANYPRAAANFTIEGWGQCPTGDSGTGGNGYAGCSIRLLYGPTESQEQLFFGATNWPNGFSNPDNSSASFGPGFYVGAYVPSLNDAKPVQVDPTEPYHLCVQRIQSVYYFYINGLLQFTATPPETANTAITDPVELRWTSDSDNLPAGNKLGQLRMTYNGARYSAAGFIPSVMPFRR